MASSQSHPLPTGEILQSPGSQFRYRIIGPCCRLFDREQLPWPCCRIQWHSKEPSWRRVGKRLVPDMATKRYPSYSVELVGYKATPELVGYKATPEPMILTLYTQRLSASDQDWWHTRQRPTLTETPDKTADLTLR